ncbi:helix-turn-helix domain-containing protein [Sphingobacterium rhinopitheci]|uniref:helix-turn-helix domain-containing protein n=1 Tax=Sphingobacterium rhinopitheci TaxID=2781960 RepID=UPI001F52757B|nr:helix-turn-helix transcriptional regulator [Sphingobacterium rhinopitheci]MCI0922538.1 helix-turn-helix transcriptional regulator [Sphingobacterium rhinopitheci]
MEKLNKVLKNEKMEDFNREFLSYNEQNVKKPFSYFSSVNCLSDKPILYRRRDYYKVSFLVGEYVVHYGDESIKINGISLSFFSPSIPYTIEQIDEKENAGYFIFTENYYDTFFNQSIKNFPLFYLDKKPIFQLNQDERKIVETIFKKIEANYHSDYALKDDIIRNHINELMHFANKLCPATERDFQLNSRERLYNVFCQLLDQQYPVDIDNPRQLRTASEFADVLNVHVNYLNRVLKEITGKSTSDLLFDRLLKESIILLKHTNWNIAEIAYSMGFKDISHFNHFFRKKVNNIPSYYRA